jgi:hypothetical protein
LPEERRSSSTPRRRDKPLSGRGPRKVERTPSGLQRRFVDVLGWGIFGLWSASFLVDMIPNYSYDPPAGIHVLMTMVAGAAFTSTLIKRNGGDDK